VCSLALLLCLLGACEEDKEPRRWIPPGAGAYDVASSAGADTSVDTGWVAPAEPVPFDEGVYVVLSTLELPASIPLTLIADVQLDSQSRVAMVGADGDPLEGAPQDTQDPRQLLVDSTENGYVLFATGGLRREPSGERRLLLGPFGIDMSMAGIRFTISGARVDAKVTRSGETGKDRLRGTLTFESATMGAGDKSYELDGEAASFEADFVPPELVPAGTPRVCGDLCGDVPAQCDPPEGFPGHGFCGEGPPSVF